MANKPNMNSDSAKELVKVEKQFDDYKENLDQMTLDRMNLSPKIDVEPQTKMSQSDIDKSKEIYLKPARTIGSREKFNENYRKDYDFDKEYVQFTAENREIIGEVIEMWTKPYAGIPCEFWKVPVNKPVWGPRYLAEQIKRCNYHRFTMQQNTMTSADGMGTYHGNLVVDTTIQRLDALPVNSRRSVFMGSRTF
jgi:hypothetical protein